jgi:hypothetical protein
MIVCTTFSPLGLEFVCIHEVTGKIALFNVEPPHRHVKESLTSRNSEIIHRCERL